MSNKSLTNAKKTKNDEFYTQLSDVSKELMYYREHFNRKVVYCNCDNPVWSSFWIYFHKNFSNLGLKRLISTYYEENLPTYKMVYEGGDDNNIDVGEKSPLQGNGDFRNKECVSILKESDIVVTNPPFSLFREYVTQLMKYEKKFLIIGNINAIKYKEFFPLIMNNKVWVGYKFNGKPMEFIVPDDYPLKGSVCGYTSEGKKYIGVGGTCWFTNCNITKRHEKLVLRKVYTPEEYPTYDNFNAINVNKTAEIPSNYDGVMGVPISFLGKYNPNQFEIVGLSRHNDLNMDGGYWKKGTCKDALINGKIIYTRILIKKIPINKK